MTYSLGLLPESGKARCYVTLSELRNCSADEALSRLEALGYKPELRYRQHTYGIDVMVLLWDEFVGAESSDTYKRDELLKLYDAFPGDDLAIHFQKGDVKEVVVNK